MNNTSIAIIILVVLVVLGGVGFVMWNNYNSAQVALLSQDQTPVVTDTTTVNPNPVVVNQPSAPIVQTNSTTAPYISTVVVSGTVNPSGALTTYWYEYGQTSALGAKTNSYSVGSGYINFYTPAYITGLVSNTTYYFRLNASNEVGTINGTIYSFKTNTTPSPSLTTPIASTTSVTNITRTSVNLNGQINPKNSITTYWFEYGQTANLGQVTTFQTSNNDNVSVAVLASVTDLQPLTKYYFRLNAQNQFGTVNGQILNFTTSGPGNATAPSVSTNSTSAITSTSAKLNASINPRGASTTYWFEYSTDSALSVASSTSEQALNNSGSSAINVSSTINSLTNNTKYYARVVANNQYGTVRSEIISFTTKK